jgi:NAD(P)-dependent dehydrogenase (short-subunit alcohol dehydrogenase family)
MPDAHVTQQPTHASVPARVARDERNGVRLLIGANRGIGLALLKAQLADPAVTRVIATHRPGADLRQLATLSRLHPGKVTPFGLDIADDDSIEKFAAFLQQLEGGIDIAIHAAGILHENQIEPEKSFTQCKASHLKRLFEVNSVGPLMVASALLPTLTRKRRFTFAALSAMVGSITDNRLGGWYGYRASKTALNQFVKTLANECRTKYPNGSIVAIHPGTTDTDLSRPFQRGVKPGKLYTPEQTAARILQVLEGIDPDQSGQFISWDGSQIPW